jgi:hypothetical protein
MITIVDLFRSMCYKTYENVIITYQVLLFTVSINNFSFKI